LTTKYQILKLLEENDGKLVSGGDIAEKLSISRTAVWKQIAALQQDGYRIISEPSRGYLLQKSDVLSAYEIEKRLTTHTIAHPVLYFPTIDSTNVYAKSHMELENGALIVASHQTAGVGRLARKFHSPEGQGIYLSILLHPNTIAVTDISTITQMTAVAVVDTIEQLSGVRPDIKWTNDVYLHGRKLCGILTEASIEGESGLIRSIIVGIGLNLYQNYEDLAPDIREIAGSVYSETGVKISAADYVACLSKNFEKYYLDEQFPANKASFLKKYRDALFFLGQTVQVVSVRETYPAVAEDIDENGCLIVRREDGTRTALNSGEISLKIPRK
jgi:BirA family biotin operon repressor/biotin-[acetyl-CoA-carboxylase] ligase